MKNRISQLFQEKKNVLSIYFTAGFPALNDTVTIIKSLEDSGVDLIEVGMPYSDPLADGPVIQQSSQKAIQNGMTLKVLFEQLKNIRKDVNIPLILMGYFNPVLQFGIDNFCKACREVGIDGLIVPDLPMDEYLDMYKPLFDAHGLSNIFLITPQSSTDRIKKVDEVSNSFIYMVSSAATTGKNTQMDAAIPYFERIQALKLQNPSMVGFGIADNVAYNTACKYANGAIIGTAFIRAIEQSKTLEADIRKFVNGILSK